MKIQLSDHFTYSRLFRFTLSSVCMMIFTSIYTIVDGFFVSNFVGKTSFAAVNLILPPVFIIGTVGFMLGTGGTAIVAKTMGEGNREKANSYFSMFVYVAIAAGTAFSAVGFLLLKPVSVAMGASGELLEDCITYGSVMLAAMPFFILQVMFQSFVVAAEKPRFGFLVTVLSGLSNIILDATLCTLLPREYKLIGAAIATASSMAVGGIVPLFYFGRKNSSLLKLGKTRFQGKVLLRACLNGSSEFMTNIAMNVISILFNRQLMKYAGENGISAYGVIMYVSMIFTAVFIGYSMGVSPVISYHLGAGNTGELRSLLRKSLIIVALSGILMVVAGELLAVPISYFYVGYDSELLALTVSGFRIFAFSFAFMGFGIILSGFFTALNDGVTSAIISFVRTLVLESVSVLILPLIFDVDGIWYSVILAEALAMLLGILMLAVKRKKFFY
ncbi:MAG: MATE family efflux transporter [Clostridia bacterium]|nr:MATE family efflux transporter [Clostridia bacterium]